MPLIISLAVVGALLLVFASSAITFVVLRPSSLHVGNTPVSGAASATPTDDVATNVIFHDPLTSNVNGWADDTHCFFGPDGYHVKDGYICYAPIGELTNLDVSVDVKQISGPNLWFYGLVFRRTSTGNYYRFLIDSNGKWEADKVVNGQESTLLPYVPNSAIKSGLNVTNTIEVRAIGSHFDFFVNSTKVGQLDDSTFASGRIGVNGSSNVEVVYTNLSASIPGGA